MRRVRRATLVTQARRARRDLPALRVTPAGLRDPQGPRATRAIRDLPALRVTQVHRDSKAIRELRVARQDRWDPRGQPGLRDLLELAA